MFLIMNYEQKYKELVGKIEKAYLFAQTDSTKAVLEDICPELAGSEDERIRKEIIAFLKENLETGGRADETWSISGLERWITWLEKQGEKTNPYSGISFEYNGHTWGMCARDNGVDILLDKQLFTHLEKQGEQNGFAKEAPASHALSFINYLDAHRYEGKMCVSNEECEDIGDAFHNAMWDKLHRYYCKYIEKQGEQKDPCEDCSHPKLNCDNFPCIEKKAFEQGKSVFDVIKTEHEQNPTDKVEPKFKVGDWIVDNRTGVVHYIAKIKDTVDGCYYVLGYDKGLLHIDNESDYHLWTIKDSKDGDVLAVDGRPFIYDGSKNSVTVGAYCGFNEENIFRRTYNSVINQNIVPATKKQRDFLFQKMGELGYMWDSHDKMIICSTDTESK